MLGISTFLVEKVACLRIFLVHFCCFIRWNIHLSHLLLFCRCRRVLGSEHLLCFLKVDGFPALDGVLH